MPLVNYPLARQPHYYEIEALIEAYTRRNPYSAACTMPPQLYRFKLERATIAVFDDWMSTASTHDGDCFLGKMMVIVWDGLYSSPTTLFWHGVRSEWIERHDMFTVREGVTYA